MTAPPVEVEGVDVRLGGVSILDDVTLTLEAGRFVGLVGPNGAGKTTLLRAINRRVTPTDGVVRLDGDRAGDLSTRAVARRVATVPQDTALSFPFDVREVVEMGRHPHRGRLATRDPGRDRVARALERTRTADLADRSITAVSGGERQRVLLARALAQDTPVMLLDEPTASLDIHHQVRTLELARDLVDREGKAILAAIHDLDLAARYCDRLALLADGRIRATGEPGSVLRDGALADAFGIRVAVGRDPVTGTPSVTGLPDPQPARGVGVHVVCGGGSGASVLAPLVAAGFDVSTGVLHETDPDRETAAHLDCDVVTAPPYTPIGDEPAARATELARAADVAVLADLDVGPGNLANLDVAAAADRVVVVEGRPFAARNHAGEAARRRYRALRERGSVTDPADLVETVIAALDGERVGRQATPAG